MELLWWEIYFKAFKNDFDCYYLRSSLGSDLLRAGWGAWWFCSGSASRRRALVCLLPRDGAQRQCCRPAPAAQGFSRGSAWGCPGLAGRGVGAYPVSGVQIRLAGDEVLPAVVATCSHSHVQGRAAQLGGQQERWSDAWNNQKLLQKQLPEIIYWE